MKSVIHTYSSWKESTIEGRYLPHSAIQPLIAKHQGLVIGASEQDQSIYKIELGSGPKKVLLWSQMHGNESTGTKAMFDILNLCASPEFSTVLKACTLVFIPMLNPDGANAYTRVNAHNIDLNRDAVARKAKESKLLRSILDAFNPDFCFNLHDQRTIFGVSGTRNPAVLSFLAPSTEVTRSMTPGREKTMNVIGAMNDVLQGLIPGHIGRYTDEFYPTATGDNFQKLGYPTVLVESGHYPDDYERELTRKFTSIAIAAGLMHIAKTSEFSEVGSYFEIPNNNKDFYDVIHRYADRPDEAYQYVESIRDKKFVLSLKKVPGVDAKSFIGHKEIVFVA